MKRAVSVLKISILLILILLLQVLVTSSFSMESGGWVKVTDSSPRKGVVCTMAFHQTNFGAPLPSFKAHGSDGCETDMSVNIALTLANVIFYIVLYKVFALKFNHLRIFRTRSKRIISIFVISVVLAKIMSALHVISL